MATKKTVSAKKTAPVRNAAPHDERRHEHVAALRQGEARQRAFRRRAVVFGSVAAVLALAAGIGIGLAAGDKSGAGSGTEAGSGVGKGGGKLVTPAHAGGAGGTVITWGKAGAPTTVQVYEDLRCPYCAAFEKDLGGTLTSMVDSGKVKVEFHMAAFLDKRLGGQGSQTGLAALGAALDESVGKFKAFHDALYAAQPKDESTDTFGSSAKLLEIAGKVPGLRTPAFNKAVKEGTYLPWAAKVADAFYASDATGTPTVKVDGRTVNVLDGSGKPVSAAAFTQTVEQAAAAE
ncbi:thioredoxin domain-containing protein [Streptomyces sp. NPDC000987]|uniref:DsbA family protein n=1 Tax=Streptomyces sp. NPDC000987 TaxID=3154374 RepID=UPI003332A25C